MIEEKKTRIPICKINGKTYEYYLCLTEPDETYTTGLVYLGRGTTHFVKGIDQRDRPLTRHFYRKKIK